MLELVRGVLGRDYTVSVDGGVYVIKPEPPVINAEGKALAAIFAVSPLASSSDIEEFARQAKRVIDVERAATQGGHHG